MVHVRHAYRPGYVDGMAHMPMLQFTKKIGALIDGSPGATIDPRVAPRSDELVITKRAISAFAGTELDPVLRSRGIDTVVLAGVVTHYVVEGTARHAADLGYRFIVLADACASADPARHDNALKNLGPLGNISTSDRLWENL